MARLLGTDETKRTIVRRAPVSDEGLRRQVEILRRGRHPGVEELLSVHEDGDLVVITLSVPGGPGLDRLNLPIDEVAGVMAVAATTMADLHEIGIVHRSLRSGVLVLGADGRPVVTRFEDAALVVGPAQGWPHSEEAGADVAALASVAAELLSRTSARGDGSASPVSTGQQTRPRQPARMRRRRSPDPASAMSAAISQAMPPNRLTARAFADAIVDAVPTATLPIVSALTPARVTPAQETPPGPTQTTPTTPAPATLGNPATLANPATAMPQPPAPAWEPSPTDTTSAPAPPESIPGLDELDQDQKIDAWLASSHTDGVPPQAVQPGPRPGKAVAALVVLAAAAMAVVMWGPTASRAPTRGTSTAMRTGTTRPPASPSGPDLRALARQAGPDAQTSPPGSGNDPPEGAPASYAEGVLTVGGHRYSLGQPGDVIAVGRWQCQPQPGVALLRVSTGQVFVFSAWPSFERAAVATEVGRVPSATALRPSPLGACDELVVEKATGEEVALDPWREPK